MVDQTEQIATTKATITVPDADTGFQTREEVLSAVVYMRDNFTELVNYLDAGMVEFEDELLIDSYIQTVQSYVPVWTVVSTVIKAALDVAFSLPMKRTTILATSSTILDLCWRFYRNIDDATLDYFILTNTLNGNDIIEVPAGREIVYYE